MRRWQLDCARSQASHEKNTQSLPYVEFSSFLVCRLVLNETGSTVPMFKPAPKRRRSPELLGSDESSAGEDNGDQSRTEKSKDSSNKPRTLKHLPNQLPDLPPKHSYMRTAVSWLALLVPFVVLIGVLDSECAETVVERVGPAVGAYDACSRVITKYCKGNWVRWWITNASA